MRPTFLLLLLLVQRVVLTTGLVGIAKSPHSAFNDPDAEAVYYRQCVNLVACYAGSWLASKRIVLATTFGDMDSLEVRGRHEPQPPPLPSLPPSNNNFPGTMT